MPHVIAGFTEHEAARLRPLALAAFEDARARAWPFLSDVLDRALRGVAVDDAAAISAMVHALVKYDRLLAFLAHADEAGAKLDRLLSMAFGPQARREEDDARLARIEHAVERRGVTFSLPDWLVARIEADVGTDVLDRVLARMNELAPRTARVNSLKTTRDGCAEALAREGIATRRTSHATLGLIFEGRCSPFRTRPFAQGELEMQDEASQIVGELVAPPPGSSIVDACAGAGGKTLGLAAALSGKGRIVALDVSEAKLGELRRRVRRAGASNVRAVAVDLLEPGEALRPLEGSAARVLVDAPCTGLGAIRRNPELRWRLRPEQLDSLGEAQGRLLRASAALVAPRGRLIYATCSFLRSEGEEVFQRFLADDERFSLVTVRDVLSRARTEPLATRDGKYLRTWRFDEPADEPSATMDGFFAAVARLDVQRELAKENAPRELANGDSAPERP